LHKLESRFWKKVKKTPTCWLWIGGRHGTGYGQISSERTSYKAHRVSWEIHNGPIPIGLHVLHDCDNPPCVRPDHLHLGTHAINMHEMALRGRAAPKNGEQNGKVILTEKQARLIKYGGGRGIDRAREFGVSKATVSAIRKGRIWAWL
jgi:HNH endonuclease